MRGVWSDMHVILCVCWVCMWTHVANICTCIWTRAPTQSCVFIASRHPYMRGRVGEGEGGIESESAQASACRRL